MTAPVNYWSTGARAWIACRYLAGETQTAIAADLDTTASCVCQQLYKFCNEWSGKGDVSGIYNAERKHYVLLALRNHFIATGEEPRHPRRWPDYQSREIDDLDYFAARREHVWLLRLEGLSFGAIAPRLGVTPSRVYQMFYKFQRDMRHAIRRTRFHWTATEVAG